MAPIHSYSPHTPQVVTGDPAAIIIVGSIP